MLVHDGAYDITNYECAYSLFREINLMLFLNHPSVLKFVRYYLTNFEEDPQRLLQNLLQIVHYEIFPSWNHRYFLLMIIIYRISSGISYLHAKNVIHHDLKTRKKNPHRQLSFSKNQLFFGS